LASKGLFNELRNGGASMPAFGERNFLTKNAGGEMLQTFIYWFRRNHLKMMKKNSKVWAQN
jgi:hypothetical protein